MEKNEFNNRCFIIMPFSTPKGYEDNHFTKIYEQIIKPAVIRAGLEPERVDENLLSTDIVTKIFKGLTECDMAICDLSSRNPNVLYELGIRQAYNKPVLLIKDEKTEKIFDVGGITTIPYESNRLYENVTDAVKRICDALKDHTKNREGVVDIIKARLGNDFKESMIPTTEDMDYNQQMLSLLQSLTDDIDSIKKDLNKKNKTDLNIKNNKFTEKQLYEMRIQRELENFKIENGYYPEKDELLNFLLQKYGDMSANFSKKIIDDIYAFNMINK